MTNNTPFDLDRQVADEHDGIEPFEFIFAGETFTCASPNDFDVRELGKILERGGQDPALLLALMLGEEQWGRLEAVEAVFTTRHLNALVKAWLAHYGLDLGKSGGSAGH